MKAKILSLLLLILALLTLACACDKREPEASGTSDECAHVQSDWITDVEATVDNPGGKHTECILCGQTLNTGIIPTLSLTEDEIFDKLKSAAVKVICYDFDGVSVTSMGSGFFIDTDGTFITNAHVVKDCHYIEIQTYQGVIYDVDVIYSYNSTVSDFAICKATVSVPTEAVQFSQDVSVGETVYALGYPNGKDEVTMTSGTITDVDSINNGKHYYLNTAKIDHGSSGGILANGKGKVIGITTGSMNEEGYVAIRYNDIKLAITSEKSGSTTPLDYFHTVDKIPLNSENADDYFKTVVYASSSENKIEYWIAVSLKDEYKGEKISIDYTSVTVTIKIETVFSYEGIESVDTQYLSCSFAVIEDLAEGCQLTASSSIDANSEYEISYTVSIIGAEGSIIIYDSSL